MSTNPFQELYEADLQLKMARNHLSLFSKVVPPNFIEYKDLISDKTMLSIERLYDLFLTVKYLNEAKIEGDFLEVGTWKGGALAMCLLADETKKRKVIGFDTFEGHLPPNVDEFDIRGANMLERWKELKVSGLAWAKASFDECKDYLLRIAENDNSRVELYKGDVKSVAIDFPRTPLSILRIDCDWYPETLFSLEKFWPMLELKGFLILDDFGHHSGQKKAVEEFFQGMAIKITHIDYSCVSIQKI